MGDGQVVSSDSPLASLTSRLRAPRKKVAEIILVVALAIVAIGVLRERAQNQPMSLDESRWIATSRYFWTTFVDWDLFGPDWQPSYVVFTHPPVARYVIGFGLWLQGWSPDQLNGRYDSERSREYNARAGNIPSRELTQAARRVTLCFAVGATLLLYVVGRSLAGPVAGVAAVVLALGNLLLATLWTRALAESVLVFFCLLALVLAARLARVDDRRVRYAWPVGLGIAVGLATATKLSGALIGFGLLLFALLQTAIRSWTDRRLRGPGLWLDAGMAAFLTFVAVNPLLYPNPALRGLLLFEHRRDEMELQALGTPRLAVPEDFSVRAGMMVNRTFVEYGTLQNRLGVPLDVPLAAVGLAVVAFSTWRSLRRRETLGPQTLLLCCTISVFAVSIATFGYDSTHYFVLPLTISVLLEGVAVAQLVRLSLRASTGLVRRRTGRHAGDTRVAMPAGERQGGAARS
jgi:hypothetical protein